jgi:hypothetical protein
VSEGLAMLFYYLLAIGFWILVFGFVFVPYGNWYVKTFLSKEAELKRLKAREARRK